MSDFSRFPSSTQRLIQEIASGNITPFLGAGTSIASSENHPCASWVGLIWNALEHCQKESLLSQEEHQLIEERLRAKPLDTNKLVNSAEILSNKLGYEHGERFQQWISEAISSLPLAQTELLSNIAKLSPVNATTNYDLLIEAAAKSTAIDLQDIDRARAALLGQSRTTIHIHGHIENIQNIVFSSQSYANHTSNARHDFVQKTFSFTTSLLFIGCGNGLDDPNVGPWMQWDDEMFFNLEAKHYRLVLESELESAKDSDSRIINIAYGKQHADLGPFIGQLVKAADEIAQPSSRYAIHRGMVTSSNSAPVDVMPPAESEARSLELLGDNAARKPDFIGAIQYYEKSLAVAYDIWVEMKICQMQIELGEGPEAITTLLALKKAHGSQLRIQLNLLTAYSKLPDYQAMIPIAKEILQKKPTLAFAWDGLLIAYQGLMRYSDILRDRKIPLLLFPFSAPINERVGLAFFQTGLCLEALKCYEIVLSKKTENRTALFGKLRTLTHLGGKHFTGPREMSKMDYLKEAFALSEELKILDGQNPKIWIQRSIIQKEQGHYSDATRSLQQAKHYDAAPEEILKVEATLLIRRKRYPAAIGRLTKGIAEYPKNSQMPFQRAVARFQKFLESSKKTLPTKAFQTIERDYKRAIELDPENVLFLEQIIGFYEILQIPDKAILYRQQLQQLNQTLDIL